MYHEKCIADIKFVLVQPKSLISTVDH